MSDETLETGIPGTGVGQSPIGDQAVSPGVTKEQVSALIKELVPNLTKDNAARVEKSLADRGEYQVEREIQEAMATYDRERRMMQRAGIEIDEATANAEKAGIARDILKTRLRGSKASDSPSEELSTSSDLSEDDLEAFEIKRSELIKGYGFSLRPSDPEFVDMTQYPTPGAYLQAFERKLKEKSLRVNPQTAPPSTNQPATEIAEPRGNPDRVQTLVSGSPAHRDLMQQYQDEISKVKGGTEDAMRIRRKYRQKGLDL